jgi:methanogenic corrinoid protein MtbC1
MTRNREQTEELANPRLVAETLARLYKRTPEMKTRYGPAGRERCCEDIAYHYSTLRESMLAGDVNIFLKYIGWGRSVLLNRNVRTDDLIDCLLVMQEVIAEQASKPVAAKATDTIQLALDTFDSFAEMPPSCIDPSSTVSNLANSYLEALLSGDAEGALKVVDGAQQGGLDFEVVIQHVLQPVQRELGRLWQVNQISVAQEHYCTAVSERVLSQLRFEQREKKDSRFFVGACVEGEQHALGIRMVGEVLDSHGWRVYLTGANTPTNSLLDLVRRTNVQVLGVSCATVLYLPNLRRLVHAVKEIGSRVRIMVGGRVFNEFPGLWRTVSADAYAEDATSAVRVAEKLAPSRLRVGASE